MGLKRALMLALWAGLTAPGAVAAPPAVSAAESSVRLGLSAGYGFSGFDATPRDEQAGPIFGASTGITALTPVNLGQTGWSDLYTGVTYDFSSALVHVPMSAAGIPPSGETGHETDFYNTAIVRSGLGRPVEGKVEVIPYMAAGYQSWTRDGAGWRANAYRAGMAGLGVKIDLVAGHFWVVSADAQGMMVGSVSAGAEERISLGADYRLRGAWHAFAGLGLMHDEGRALALGGDTGEQDVSARLRLSSMFGVAYGF
jgi:outer membrane scaffolding protein for murein synthesis (MipA/OmpV family)